MWLKISPPMIVPTPMLESVKNKPINAQNTGGKESPAPMKIAPATSSEILFRRQKTDIAGTQYSSQMNAKPQNIAKHPRAITIKPLNELQKQNQTKQEVNNKATKRVTKTKSRS
jgi:hypothetical protein